MSAQDVVVPSCPSPRSGGGTTRLPPEPWETWGIAARWNPQRHWHNPDDETP